MRDVRMLIAAMLLPGLVLTGCLAVVAALWRRLRNTDDEAACNPQHGRSSTRR
jgi:TRAP-type C4-dicarboxylate transport system permease large subunit